MRRRKRTAALVLSAAVLAGAWLLAAYMADTTETVRLSEELEAVPLSPGSARELTALSWSWKGETVNLRRDGNTGRWVNADDPACPVDNAKAEALANAAAEATASMAVRGAKELGEYGLETPPLTVVAATEDRIAGYDVGNLSVTGEYFLRIHGGDTVYLVGSGFPAAFQTGVTELLALDAVPDDIAAVAALDLRSQAGDYRIACDAATGAWFRTDGDAPVRLEDAGAAALYGLVTELELTDCVAWNGAGEDYGFADPQAAGTVTYLDGRGQTHDFTLEFGDYTDGDVFARFAGSAMVFRVPGAAADGLMYPRWELLTATPAVDLDPADIASFSVTLDGAAYDVVRLEEEVERSIAPGDRAVTVTDVIYSLNGWVLDTQKIDAWLGSFSGLTAEGEVPAGEGREELFSVTFTWRDLESSPFTLTLRNYDSSHYLCLAGARRLLVSRAAADALISQARAVLKAN